MNDIVLFDLTLIIFCFKEWPHALYPPWAHGPGYIISRDIAKFIVRGHLERDLKVKFTSLQTAKANLIYHYKIHCLWPLGKRLR